MLVTFASVAFPHSGLGARARAVIEDLTALGIDLTVLSVGEPSGAQIVLEQGAVRLISVSRVRSAHWSIQLARRLSRLRRDCDVVIAESALLMPSIMLARWKGPLVWDTNELETLHYRRLPQIWSNRWRGWVWQVLERWAVQRADVVVSISEAESIWWHRLFPQVGPKLAVVDHRSPVASLGSKPRGHSALSADESCEAGPRLVFVGNLRGKHNAAAAKWIIETLAPSLTKPTKILLVGPGTEKLCVGAIGSTVIESRGEVDLLAAVVSESDVCLAPLVAAAGVKTKVLDYVALGAKVIGTPVAFEGLDSCPGLVPTSLEHFAATVDEVLRNPETPRVRGRRQRLQAAWVAEHGMRGTTEQWRQVLGRLGVETG